MNLCKENNIIYIRDLLEWYNNLDVVPMLKACLKQKEFFYTFNLDMYKDAFSLPGLSENILYQFSIKDFDNFIKMPIPINENIPLIYDSYINRRICDYRMQACIL